MSCHIVLFNASKYLSASMYTFSPTTWTTIWSIMVTVSACFGLKMRLVEKKNVFSVKLRYVCNVEYRFERSANSKPQHAVTVFSVLFFSSRKAGRGEYYMCYNFWSRTLFISYMLDFLKSPSPCLFSTRRTKDDLSGDFVARLAASRPNIFHYEIHEVDLWHWSLHTCLSYDLLSRRIVDVNDVEFRSLQRVIIASNQNDTFF